MRSDCSDDAPLYNSRIIENYIKLIRLRYPEVDVAELLHAAQMKIYDVEDTGHWFTQQDVDLFHREVVRATQNENIAREAGRFIASPQAMGFTRRHILAMINSNNVWRVLGAAVQNYTRSSKFETRYLDDNSVEVTVTPYPGVAEKKFQCENRMGYLEAIVTSFSYKLHPIAHPQCLFEGDSCCKYIVTWDTPPLDRWVKLRNFAFTLVLLLNGFLLFNYFSVSSVIVFASMSVLFLIAMVIENKKEQSFNGAIDHSRVLIDDLLARSSVTYNHAVLVSEIGEVLSTLSDPTEILNNVIHTLQKRLDYDRGLILLATRDKSKLEIKAGYGYSMEHFGLLKELSFPLNQPDTKWTFVVSYQTQEPLLVNDLDKAEGPLSDRTLAIARKLGIKSFICCPIVCDDRALGILLVDNVRGKKRSLIKSDMSLLMGIASAMGVSLRRIRGVS